MINHLIKENKINDSIFGGIFMNWIIKKLIIMVAYANNILMHWIIISCYINGVKSVSSKIQEQCSVVQKQEIILIMYDFTK